LKLFLAYRKARKGKTKRYYVKRFEKNLHENLFALSEELKEKTYKPKPLKTFILRDPKTRKISVSAFRDRIVHHAIVRVIEPLFEKTFIYDSCANRIGKGGLFAIKRFDTFSRKISGNGNCAKNKFNDFNYVYGYCLKTDIKHYFQEVDHKVLIKILERKINDKEVIWLINEIIKNTPARGGGERAKGMPLGNLTSQFFANLYLNELDYFVKHELKAKYYIRYVDDFVILHGSRKKLENFKKKIVNFLEEKLKLEIHPQKSKIIPLSKGIDFVGFRNFYHFRLLRKRNLRSIISKIKLHKKGVISKEKMFEVFQGWNAYASWANSYKIRREVGDRIY